jgi:hypothetical protein
MAAGVSYLKGDVGGMLSGVMGLGKKIINQNSGAADMLFLGQDVKMIKRYVSRNGLDSLRYTDRHAAILIECRYPNRFASDRSDVLRFHRLPVF